MMFFISYNFYPFLVTCFIIMYLSSFIVTLWLLYGIFNFYIPLLPIYDLLKFDLYHCPAQKCNASTRSLVSTWLVCTHTPHVYHSGNNRYSSVQK